MTLDRSAETSLSEQLRVLSIDDPRRYALLRRHLADLKRVLEQSSRNNASTKQLYSLWDDPPFQPQILGQLLSTLAEFGVLRVHTQRTTHNRYDLMAYDSARMHHLTTLFAAEAASNDNQTTSDQ